MIFLAVVVAALTTIFCLALASFAWQDLVIGLVLSTALLATHRRVLLPRKLPEPEYVLHMLLVTPRLLWLLGIDIVKGTWVVASIVTGLRKLEHPGIVRIPVGAHSPAGVGMVGLLVTISPGSFLVDIDWDEGVMLVHYMDASNPAQLREDMEKYYRLWEYGAHKPQAAKDDPDA